MSTSPPRSPSPYEVSKERGKKKKEGLYPSQKIYPLPFINTQGKGVRGIGYHLKLSLRGAEALSVAKRLRRSNLKRYTYLYYIASPFQ